MEQTCQNDDFGLKGEKFLEKKTDKTETPNKCNQCDYASSQAGHLKRHLKTHNGKRQTNATDVTLHPLMQAL